jgi:hypothetical protein
MGMQLPPPMKSFLKQHDLNGKTILPFNTNAGYLTCGLIAFPFVLEKLSQKSKRIRCKKRNERPVKIKMYKKSVILVEKAVICILIDCFRIGNFVIEDYLIKN